MDLGRRKKSCSRCTMSISRLAGQPRHLPCNALAHACQLGLDAPLTWTAPPLAFEDLALLAAAVWTTLSLKGAKRWLISCGHRKLKRCLKTQGPLPGLLSDPGLAIARPGAHTGLPSQSRPYIILVTSTPAGTRTGFCYFPPRIQTDQFNLPASSLKGRANSDCSKRQRPPAEGKGCLNLGPFILVP